MSFEMDIGHCSRPGQRAVNEDFVGALHSPEPGLGVVAAIADGVSTGGRGREAAQTSVMGLLADFFSTPPTWETTVIFDRLIGAQNAWLADHNRRRAREPDSTALTTLTAIALRGQTWTVAHVGDTRAWLCRPVAGSDADSGANGSANSGAAGGSAAAQPAATRYELQALTQDHAFDAPGLRSRLTRAVGLDDLVRVDYQQGDVRLGDSFVLTSDGVHGVLKPAVMAALAGPGSAQQAADALVDAALAAGSHDNVTALVLRVKALDARDLQDELVDAGRLAAAPTLRVGDKLDGYTITARVADNGVHQLYQARDGEGGALVAIKLLHPSRASDAEERAMLAHEAWLGQRISNGGDASGFVRVHARRPGATALHVVFDWHAGRTMTQLSGKDAVPAVAEVVAAAIAVARALGQLHRLGVVHRDIKPDNLHLGDDGRWRVLDLGAALSGRERSTQHGLRAGTPSYMNPEQWGGTAADSGSDLFALGVSLYQWLTGRLPYGEIEPFQIARYRRDPVAVSRLRPDVPIWLDHIVMRALARDPRQRFETAEELLLALERGAARPLSALPATPLLQRDATTLLKAGLVVSLLFNVLLVVWLLFLPR